MKPLALALLCAACLVFLAAAGTAKAWAMAPDIGKAVLTLGLYTVGNLMMLVLIREIGMATAFSLSAVLQLIAVNAMAILFFGERVGPLQAAGLVLAVVAVALITLGPRLSS